MKFFTSVNVTAVKMYGTATRGEKIDHESFAFEGKMIELLTDKHFFPDGLETNMINASIVQLWKAQKIAVCFIHAITDAVKKPNRQL